MRFTSFVAAGIFAVAANAQSSASPTVSAPSSTTVDEPAETSKDAVTQCIEACDPGDVTCTSKCIAVPSPDKDQVNDTTSCVADCDQGDGSKADNEAYGQCVDKCISDNFFTATGTPQATQTPETGSSAEPETTTFTSGGSTITSTSTPTSEPTSGSGNDDSSDESGNGGNGGDDSEGGEGSEGGNDTGAASMISVGSAIGLVALCAGMLAL